MKKFGMLVMLSVALFFGTVVAPASAAGKDAPPPNPQKMQDIMNMLEEVEESKGIERIDVSELPEGTVFINFDTVEEFEKALEEWQEMRQAEEAIELAKIPDGSTYGPIPGNGGGDEITTMATASSRIKWSTFDALKFWLPTYMVIDFSYTYSGSGNTKKYTNLTSVSSWSDGIPTNWVQTSKPTWNFYDLHRTVSITIQGYHLFGIAIGGFPIGYKIPDKFTKSKSII